MDPITIGSLGVGALGSLAGIFRHDPQYTSPTFNDVHLERDNPELWQELQNLNGVVTQLQKAYDSRRAGLTPLEQGQLNEERSGIQSREANQGLLGSSAGMAAEGDIMSRAHNAADQRAQMESNALLQQLMSGRQGYLQAFGGAQNADLARMVDQAKTRYNAQVGNNQAQNQFFSGILNGGMGLYGLSQNPLNPANRPNPNAWLPPGATAAPTMGMPANYPQLPSNLSGPYPGGYGNFSPYSGGNSGPYAYGANP